MTVVGDGGLPHQAGKRDALHNRDRVRRKLVDELKKRIGEEDIIAAGPDKKLRVPIRSDRQWRFVADRGQKSSEGVGQGDGKPGDVLGQPGQQPGEGREAGTEPGEEVYEVTLDMEDVEELLFSELQLPRLKPKQAAQITDTDIVYNDIARKGPQIDKKATLRANLKRNAMRGSARVGDVAKEDLRYLSYRELPKPRHKAVVMMLMDQSASMDAERKRIARLFFYWCVSFLRRRYDQCELVFIGHTTEAYELTEEQFFHRTQSGGTRVSSAYEYAAELQRNRYPADDWNVYVMHASDGDNFVADNEHTVDVITELTRICALVGYLEIEPVRTQYRFNSFTAHKLGAFFAERAADLPGFVYATAYDDRELWPALQRFFAKDDVEEAVR